MSAHPRTCFTTPIAAGSRPLWSCRPLHRSLNLRLRNLDARKLRTGPTHRRARACTPRATATTTTVSNGNGVATTGAGPGAGTGSGSNSSSSNGTPSDERPPLLTVSFARTTVATLVRYICDLSQRQPFIARRLMLSVFCILCSKLISVTVPFFFKRAVDALMQTGAPGVTRQAGLASAKAAAVAILLHGVTRLLASMTHELRLGVFAKAGQRIGRSVTATTFAHLHSLELAFHSGSRTGAMTRVVDRGTRAIMVIFRAMVFSFLPSFFELSLVCAVLFTKFSAAYVLVTLLTFFAFTSWTLWINNIMGRTRQEMNAVENEASAKLTDSLINVETVKVYDNEAHETRRYDAALANYEEIAIRNERLYVQLNIGQTSAYTIGLTAILLMATSDVLAGRFSVGSVILLTTMLQRLWVPLDFLGWQYREVKQSLIDVQNLFDVLRREPTVHDLPNTTSLSVSKGRIDFEDVSFSYPAGEIALPFLSKKFESKQGQLGIATVESKDEPEPVPTDGSENQQLEYSDAENEQEKLMVRPAAIENLSFSVPGGSSIALVGPSGSGKSTVTRLLCRLYDVTGGRILIDGQDIAEASLSSLRRAVSIVPQDTALFNDTIAYNIRYGRPSATDEEVVEAAKAASIHDVIMRTEHGYDTLVGERGVRFSGGERQRLSVARAFLKGSRIIVEDESTSALDTLTEMEVSKSLEKLGVNRTRIIVAHRLSTIMNVDKVIVMKDGMLAEQGSFDDLVNRPDGVFRGMWERQQRKDLVEGEDMVDSLLDDDIDHHHH